MTPMTAKRPIQQLILAIAIASSLSSGTVFAATGTQEQNLSLQASPNTANLTAPSLVPPQPELAANGYVLMDAATGKILASKNLDQRMAPASLTKMMTLYITFQSLQSGQIHLTDDVRVSKKAWEMTGSRMFLRVGTHVNVEQLIEGVSVASGNDACVALAEYIAGTEGTFAQLMNQMAQKLGMKNSHYVDSTGLPDPEQYTTPEDMAILAHALIRDFPEFYHYFSEKWITYNNIKQPNRNRLLWRDETVDGLKTGHTDEAGFCLVASAKRNDMRLITVIMGAPSDGVRAANSQALLNYGFRFYKAYPLFQANKPITQSRVWQGKEKFVALGVKSPLYVTIPASEYSKLKAKMSLNSKIRAPITAGQALGTITVTLDDQVLVQTPLVALKDNPKAGVVSRMVDRVSMMIKS